ncbi:MAG: DUF3048 domain-containing protein [Candidatus Levybacteria bacterium]|nr:DUF3048 domain-containing protein [Candidatus Levybacteria bacterium]
MKSKLVTTIVLSLIVYVISAVTSYKLFVNSAVIDSLTPVTPVDEAKKGNDFDALTFDESLPKTQECPLNGAKYSKQQKQWWEKHRPLGVMIENHEDSRPQSGISFADVIYEAVAEGGITRFLAIFYCQDAGIIGPVRSARTYFLDWVSEYGDYPLYAHVGGANTPGPANALGQIGDYGWSVYNDMNQFSIGFPTFRRDESRLGRQVATEHTMYSTTSKLWKVAESRKLTNVDEDKNTWDESFVPYDFKEDAKTDERASAQTVHLEMWEKYKQYAIDWTYDKQNNVYMRKNGGAVYTDQNTKKQLSAKNIVVLYMRESSANDGYEGNAHRLYRNKGTGNAVIFQDGKQIKATWRKDKREARTILTASDGSKIEFNRGLIWFEILPLEGVLEVK